MDNPLIDPNDLTDMDKLTALMARLNEAVNKIQETIAPLEEQKHLNDKLKSDLKAEYEEKMRDLYAQGKAVDEGLFDARKQLKAIQRDAESVTRQYHELKRAKELAEAYATLETRWDMLTAGAPWREWAKDHQIEAARKIAWSQRMILADTMGLGKTLSAIASLDIIKAATQDARVDNPIGGDEVKIWNHAEERYEYVNQGGVTKPCGNKILYVCPATMLDNVKREFKRWAPHRSVIILGLQTKATRRFILDTLTFQDEYVVILNYEAWRKDMNLIADLTNLEFDTLIIDEAHNVKDRKSIAYRGLKQLADQSGIPFVIPMTGTPILNRPQELFALLTFTDPNRFYSERNFLFDYCTQDFYTQKWRFKPGGIERLSKAIASRFLRRTKEQAGIILPPKTILIHEVEVDKELYPNQARVREEMRKWGSIILDPDRGKAITAAAMIAVYTRLRQIETWPAGIKIKDPLTGDVVMEVDVTESQKIDEIIRPNGPLKSYDDPEGLIPEVVEDERVVVYSQFTEPLREIARRCDEAGIKAVILDGSTPKHVRDEIMIDFDASMTPERENSKWDVVLCNYKVGGVGMNLTAATQMIILDEEWNPGKRDQAYDRIHRIGQEKPVTIHVLRDTGTIDNWLAGIITEKEGIVDGFHEVADTMALDLWNAIKDGLV